MCRDDCPPALERYNAREIWKGTQADSEEQAPLWKGDVQRRAPNACMLLPSNVMKIQSICRIEIKKND